MLHRIGAALVVLLALACVSPQAWAQKVGPEFRVNSFTASEQSSPSVARLSDGGFVVAWTSANQDGSFDGIYGQRYSAAGKAAGGEFKVNTYTTRNQNIPSVAGLSDGGFVIAWTSGALSGAGQQDGSMYGVYAQRYNAAGAPAGGELRVNTQTTEKQWFPSVAGLIAGGFVVVWQSAGQDGSSLGIYAQRFTGLGARLGNEFRINTTTAGTQERPSIAALTGGSFVVTWDSPDGSASGVYGRRYSSAGTPVTAEFRVNTFTTLHQYISSVAALHDGGFIVTWQSEGQDGSGLGVYGQRYSATGARANAEFRINGYTTSHQSRPSVAGFGNGGFVVTWHSDGQDGSDYGVYGQRYTAAGAPVGGEFLVNTRTAFSQKNPSVAALGEGNSVVAWTSYVQDSAGGGIYAQRFADPAPKIILNPVSRIVFAGLPLPAAFTADASGLPAPTVQWQSRLGLGRFANIPGAIAKTLSLPPVTLSQNGTQYRAVFSNPWGRAITTAATLTVRRFQLEESPNLTGTTGGSKARRQ